MCGASSKGAPDPERCQVRMRRLQGSWEGMAELHLEEEAKVSQMVERAWDSLGKCMENPRVGGFTYEARMVGALSHF